MAGVHATGDLKAHSWYEPLKLGSTASRISLVALLFLASGCMAPQQPESTEGFETNVPRDIPTGYPSSPPAPVRHPCELLTYVTAPDSRGGRFVGVNDGWAVWISEGLNSAGQPDRDVKGYNFTTGLTQTLVGGWDVVSTLHVGPNAIYWRSENDTTNEIRIYRMDLEDQVPIEIPWTRGVPALRGVDDGNLLIASGDGIVIHDLAENRTRRVWQDYPIEARINGDWLVWTQSIEGSEHSEVELHAMTVEGRRHNTIEVPVAGSPVVIEGTVYFTGVSPNRVEWKLHRWNSSTDHEEIWTPPGAARSSLDQADAHGHHLVYLRYPPFGIDVVDLANNTAFLAKSGTSENPVIRGRIMAWNTGYSVEITCLDSGLTKLG